MTQAVQCAVLPRTRACDQSCICDELAEGLVDVLGYGSIGQSEHWQINALLKQILKRYVLDVVTALMDALEVVDGARSADDITSPSFTVTRSSPSIAGLSPQTGSHAST